MALDVKKFSLVRRLDTEELGIYIDYIVEDYGGLWHKMSYPSQKEWYGKEENFIVLGPPLTLQAGDKVRYCDHGRLNMNTYGYDYVMKEAVVVECYLMNETITIEIDGVQEQVFKGYIYPLQFPNKLFKASLDK